MPSKSSKKKTVHKSMRGWVALFFLVFAMLLTVMVTRQSHNLTQEAQTIITPTLYCLGACPTIAEEEQEEDVPDNLEEQQATEGEELQVEEDAEGLPVGDGDEQTATVGGQPAADTQPCPATDRSLGGLAGGLLSALQNNKGGRELRNDRGWGRHHYHHRHHRDGGGLMQGFLRFFMQLLQIIFQLPTTPATPPPATTDPCEPAEEPIGNDEAATENQVSTELPKMVCTNTTGQLCSPMHSETIQTDGVLKVNYTVGEHCSPIRMHFYLNGVKKYTSGWLGWSGATGSYATLPLETGDVNLGLVTAGSHEVSLQAEGQMAGCNTGKLNAWLGSIVVTTSTATLPTDIPEPTEEPVPTDVPEPTDALEPTQVVPTLRPATPTPTRPIDMTAYFISGINKYRASKGLKAVKSSTATCNFATTRAKELLTSFSHDKFNSRIKAKTLPYASWSSVTENIAQTSRYQDVITMWINSPPHAANMRADTPYVCVKQNGQYFAYEGMKP